MNKPKIIYFAPIDIKLPRVDRKCIMYACEGFKKVGANIHLVSLDVKILPSEKINIGDIDQIFKLYGIENKFDISILPSIGILQSKFDNKFWRKLMDIERFLRYSVYILSNLNKRKSYYIYSKNYFVNVVPLILKKLGIQIKLIFEVHTLPKHAVNKFLLSSMDYIVANTLFLAKELKKANLVPPYKIMGTHQGINLEMINKIRRPREESRKILGLPLSKKIVVYTGKVAPKLREIDFLLELARRIEKENAMMVIVGGKGENVDYYRRKVKEKRLKNVLLPGFQRYPVIHYYQFAADVLVSFYDKAALSMPRSPGKLFEYMASLTPIVSVKCPSIEEVLKDGYNSLLVEPENLEQLAVAVKKLLKNEELGRKLSRNAFEDVKNYTWEVRQRRILEFIGYFK